LLTVASWSRPTRARLKKADQTEIIAIQRQEGAAGGCRLRTRTRRNTGRRWLQYVLCPVHAALDTKERRVGRPVAAQGYLQQGYLILPSDRKHRVHRAGGRPRKCTGSIVRVRAVIAASISRSSRLKRALPDVDEDRPHNTEAFMVDTNVQRKDDGFIGPIRRAPRLNAPPPSREPANEAVERLRKHSAGKLHVNPLKAAPSYGLRLSQFCDFVSGEAEFG
jgi:hypothetical protein